MSRLLFRLPQAFLPQAKVERGAETRLRLDPNPAAMLFDDLARDGQSHARAGMRLVIDALKQSKDAVAVRGIGSAAVVPDRILHSFLGVRRSITLRRMWLTDGSTTKSIENFLTTADERFRGDCDWTKGLAHCQTYFALQRIEGTLSNLLVLVCA